MTYHRPPDDYRPPTHCEQCGAPIQLVPVVGGALWRHVTDDRDHEVKMRAAGWWDTSDGVTRYGTADGRLEAALAGEHPAEGITLANAIECRR